MKIENMNLSSLTEAEMEQVEGGAIGLLILCFAAGVAIGLALT